MMTVMKKKNTFRLKQKLYEWWSYILKNRNNKYDCIVIDRFLMGKDSKDNNKNKDMITYSYLQDTHNKHKDQ